MDGDEAKHYTPLLIILRESRFIMASSSFSDAPNPETSEGEAKSVTIVINDNGEINYDEKTLQSIIDSNQPSATVTFVRVSGGADNAEAEGTAPVDAAVPEDPILMLDQDQITKLENLLRSEEAKDFLGEVLSTPGSNPNESLGDFLTPATAEAVGQPPPLIPNDEIKEQLQQDQTKSKSNWRKSQRQLDRELKEEAEKIRKENQKMLKKEKEAMRRQSRGEAGDVTEDQEEDKSESNDTPPPTPTVASTRPRRERKLPAHLKAGDFEYSYKGINDTKKKTTPAKDFKAEEEEEAAQIGELNETMEEKDESKDELKKDSDDEDSGEDIDESKDELKTDSDDEDSGEDMNSEDADSEDDPQISGYDIVDDTFITDLLTQVLTKVLNIAEKKKTINDNEHDQFVLPVTDAVIPEGSTILPFNFGDLPRDTVAALMAASAVVANTSP